MRRLLFWLHLTTGLVVGTIVLILSLTGILLAFQRQIVAFNERDLRVTPPANATIQFAKLAMPRATAITIRADRTLPATIQFGRERMLLVDPWTGRVLGDGAKRSRAFFRAIEEWHRFLGATAKRRDTGRAITGAANAGFLLLVLSGIYLWWPGKVGRVRRGLGDRARNFNWHNVAGVWAWAALVVIVASGVVMSYARPGAPPRAERKTKPIDIARVGPIAFREATRRVPDWKTITIRLPNTIAIDAGNGARPDLRTQLELDANGAVTRVETYATQSAWRRFRAWARWSHTGEAAGLTGQLIATFASIAACLLVWTGVTLALHRFKQWRKA